MRDAAHNAAWPAGRAILVRQDSDWRNAKFPEGPTRTASTHLKLVAALLDGSLNDSCFAGKKRVWLCSELHFARADRLWHDLRQ